ncbi:glutathione S-transferase [Durotheca rogersii]|uniref:glutathione S-transferase n=1 Tax=Durotheca rogersii TaxID=419775 RepID=UPI00221EB2F6|nr:glutathione S-transferase [Durotheca rogersii]KAI5868197.1 glutathione S-transferase [Durotheca rogersii]
MAPFGKIYTYPQNFRATRALVVAAINGLEVTEAENFTMGVTNRSPEFLAKFPHGKVPAFEGADGFTLSEGAAIAIYLARSGPKAAQLLGSDPKTSALIDQWVFFAETELVSNVMTAFATTIFKIIPFEEAKFNQVAANTERAVKRLELHLQGGKKFLVGDSVTLADVLVAGPLFAGTTFFIDAEMRKDAPNVVAYLQGLAALPEFKPLGPLSLCETRTKP